MMLQFQAGGQIKKAIESLEDDDDDDDVRTSFLIFHQLDTIL